MAYDNEIQELLYDTLVADTSLKTALGGGTTDKRIYLEWNSDDLPKLSGTKPGFITIGTMGRSEALGEKHEVEMISTLRLYTRPDDRTTRTSVLARIEALLYAPSGEIHRGFTTDSYLVFTKDGGVDDPVIENGVLVTDVNIKISYLPG